jgi:hypothetical protein
MKIPTSFPLLSRTARVKFAKIDEQGLWDHTNALVVIALDLDDVTAFEVFCHELTHAILECTAYDKLSEDEAFVERFGGLLAQALQGMVYGDS